MFDTDTSPLTAHDAATQIAGLLDFSGDYDAEPKEQEDSTEHNSDELAQDENLASDEDTSSDDDVSTNDEDEHEPDESSAIEPPKSWSAEDKKLFSKLPPDAQQIIARRESERDNAISQRMQTIAEERKAVEAEVQRINQVQQHYVQTLNQLATLTAPELQKYNNVNWQQLAQDDPAEYVRMNAQREATLQRYNAMIGEMQRVQQEQQAKQSQHYQARLEQEKSRLIEMVPEFADSNKAKALVNDIGSTFSSYGFTPEEIGNVADSRMVRAMARLATLEKAEAARKSALSKKGTSPAPRLMTPSTANREDNNGKRVLKDLNNRLSRTGSARDAQAIIESML